LALRGQVIGGALGCVGLIGSFVVAALGHEWVAAVIGTASLISLVSIFVVGRDKQKQERAEKAVIRERIRRSDPVEDIEKTKPPAELPPEPSKLATKSRSKPN